MRLVFLGPPGVGKGTIAGKTETFFHIPHISTGDLFRENITNETPLGKEVKKILAEGSLVPDSITIQMVKQRLQKSDTENGYILDGFPRTIAQAEALEGIDSIDHVINFFAPREEIVKRLSGRRIAKQSGKVYHVIYDPPKEPGICDITGEPLIQRPDDTEEAIEKRLDVYREQTEPLIGFYRERELLIDIDASGTPDEIFQELTRIIR